MVKLQHLIDFVEGKIGRDDFQCIDIQNEIEREKSTKSYYLPKERDIPKEGDKDEESNCVMSNVCKEGNCVMNNGSF